MTSSPISINDSKATTGDESSFGFKQVKSDERQSMVNEVFDSVASRYDIMNDIMSMGLHHFWKEALAQKLAARPNWEIIDVAGGTGDIAMAIQRDIFHKYHDYADITICDINPNMLEVGRNRVIDKNIDLLQYFDFIAANAEEMPFESNSYDAYTIAFGIRNVTNRLAALKEAHRILRPCSQFICMEFCPNIIPAINSIYDKYSFNVIPAIGEKITGDKESYSYLVESIRKFPDADDFAAEMKQVGFENISYRKLSLGVVAIYSGWKI